MILFLALTLCLAGVTSANEINFARYEKISFIMAKHLSKCLNAGGTNLANLLNTLQGQATGLEIDDLPAFVSEFTTPAQCVLKEISRFGGSLKNIYVVNEGQQVYMTPIPAGLRTDMINTIRGLRSDAGAIVAEFNTLLADVQKFDANVKVDNFGNGEILPVITKSIGQIFKALELSNTQMSAGLGQLGDYVFEWVNTTSAEQDDTVENPLEKIGRMFDTMSSMYQNLATLAQEITNYYGSEMQSDGEINFPVFFVHLNDVILQAAEQFDAGGLALGQSQSYFKKVHPKPIYLSTVSSFSADMNFGSNTGTFATLPSF